MSRLKTAWPRFECPRIQWRSVVAALLLSAAPALALAENAALTFDDLPLNGTLAPDMTRVGIVKDVLGILKKRRVPQVYGFVNSKRFENDRDGAEALKAWVAGGQRVGSHSYSHFDLSKVTSEVFLTDVAHNEPVLQLLSPGDDWRWFRYPFLHEGDTLEKRHAVRAGLRAAGYRTAQVTVDWEDYLWNSAYARCVAKHDKESIAWLKSSYLELASAYIDADRQMAQMVFQREISHVVLLHLGAYSATILPDLLDLLRDKGFKLVTLEEAQKDAAYESDPDAALKNGGTLLEQWVEGRGLKFPSVPEKPYQRLGSICQ